MTREREVLLEVGASSFFRMKYSTRPEHVVKHLLNLDEAWWQLGLSFRNRIEARRAEFEARGVLCGSAHDYALMPSQAWADAHALHDEAYEPIIRVVLEDFAAGSDEVEAVAAKGEAGRLDHLLLCITLIYDRDGTVLSAYRGHTHPVSSGLRAQQRNHVRRARMRASFDQGGPSAGGDLP